jgi:hypothetical protein
MDGPESSNISSNGRDILKVTILRKMLIKHMPQN